MLRAVAAGVGCSYTQVSSDFSSSNYSSSRLELLETRAHYRTLQQYLIDNLCQPIYERWMEMAVMSGVVRAPGFDMDLIVITRASGLHQLRSLLTRRKKQRLTSLWSAAES